MSCQDDLRGMAADGLALWWLFSARGCVLTSWRVCVALLFLMRQLGLFLTMRQLGLEATVCMCCVCVYVVLKCLWCNKY